jgi:hydroxyethylthiazole kinase-like uncharacterized protein yjeF
MAAAAPAEVMVRPFRALKELAEQKVDVWAVGPGLGTERAADVLKFIDQAQQPMVLDADALNVFEGDARALGALLQGRSALITPHVAEFARLAGVSVEEVGRFEIGRELAGVLGATVLLKGSPTVVFTPAGDRFVVARGTAALGTGGSGDVLAGIAGTLLAQTSDTVVVACCSAWVHGRAAELCEYVRGTTLEDVLYALPRAWNESEPAFAPPVLTRIPAVAR